MKRTIYWNKSSAKGRGEIIVESKIIIGADGRYSTVRKLAHIKTIFIIMDTICFGRKFLHLPTGSLLLNLRL